MRRLLPLVAFAAALGLVPAASAARGELMRPAPSFVPAATAWLVPLAGPFESPFGARWGRLHAGVDISANLHTDVHAAVAGRVEEVGWLEGYDGYGLVVLVRVDDHLETLYAHLASARVHPGDDVAIGDEIGRAGCTGSCTGPHLHFEVRVDGQPVDPLGYVAIPR